MACSAFRINSLPLLVIIKSLAALKIEACWTCSSGSLICLAIDAVNVTQYCKQRSILDTVLCLQAGENTKHQWQQVHTVVIREVAGHSLLRAPSSTEYSEAARNCGAPRPSPA